jgi:hypothetical protein
MEAFVELSDRIQENAHLTQFAMSIQNYAHFKHWSRWGGLRLRVTAFLWAAQTAFWCLCQSNPRSLVAFSVRHTLLLHVRILYNGYLTCDAQLPAAAAALKATNVILLFSYSRSPLQFIAVQTSICFPSLARSDMSDYRRHHKTFSRQI